MEFVIGGILYFILLVTLGIITIRKGHWVMFIIGIFIPLFWIRRADAAEAARLAEPPTHQRSDLAEPWLALESRKGHRAGSKALGERCGYENARGARVGTGRRRDRPDGVRRR